MEISDKRELCCRIVEQAPDAILFSDHIGVASIMRDVTAAWSREKALQERIAKLEKGG